MANLWQKYRDACESRRGWLAATAIDAILAYALFTGPNPKHAIVPIIIGVYVAHNAYKAHRRVGTLESRIESTVGDVPG